MVLLQVDDNHDRRMTLEDGLWQTLGPELFRGESMVPAQEFQWCMSVCGVKMSQIKAEAGLFCRHTLLRHAQIAYANS